MNKVVFFVSFLSAGILACEGGKITSGKMTNAFDGIGSYCIILSPTIIQCYTVFIEFSRVENIQCAFKCH